MSNDTKKAATLAAAVSMLGLSLGVSGPAEARHSPGEGARPGTQGVLVGRDPTSTGPIRSGQLKWRSNHVKPAP